MKDLREMKVAELKEMAKEMRISNWWNLKKEKLIEKIEEKQNRSEEEKAAEAKQRAEEEKLIAIYDKDWRKYTERYNPLEFIEKVRSGKIKIEDEEPEAEEVDQKPNTLEETPAPEKPVAILTPKRGALIEYDGKSQNICAWADELGISANTLYGRLYKMGWSVEKAFTTPARRK